MENKPEYNEQKYTSSSYVLKFYESVILLTSNYANYSNLLNNINNSLKGVSLNHIPGQTKKVLLDTIANIRYYQVHCYTNYITLTKATKEQIDHNIEKINNNIMNINNSIIKIEDLKKSVEIFHSFLGKTVMKELLTSSSDYYNSVFING
jgi:hypothetical protein